MAREHKALASSHSPEKLRSYISSGVGERAVSEADTMPSLYLPFQSKAPDTDSWKPPTGFHVCNFMFAILTKAEYTRVQTHKLWSADSKFSATPLGLGGH